MTDLPPFSGDDPTCPKCGNVGARTEYRPCGQTMRWGADITSFGSDRLHRECHRRAAQGCDVNDSVSEFKAHIRAAADRGPLAQLRKAEEARTWRDAIRCAVGRHKPAITAEHGTLQRCSCGAIRFVPGGRWMDGDLFGRRRRAGRKALERAKKQIGEGV